ncbi:MAG: sigma-54-dependent Fis family transcriptional regulator [Runella slithyformis]|nr:MAG: sigma-54-dependent Fis family transcriptional regulator [Runella slithyformis]TAF97708.1 MAG: sigma-54-dependent Fis family transcriptional regulator [Runella sp.]TAG22704.1 MAG: sigma-54-dependent Fis family transcriptional regulator [Cytophagales bacterium]TAG41828.1 MAG: sigma-54-dependent Fis family transcriptional regulator [Cytophagia bacterium]TAF81508.1 MAG: sigma-54-dependent Fis family transcriptional regulator [Runella slithyformis]
MNTTKMLIIDDDVDVLSAAKLLLKRHLAQVDIEKNPERIPFLITNGNYDVILLDMNFTRDVSSGREGFQWLDRILDIDPLAVVVLFTAYGDVEMAVRAIKVGAADFVLKPWENEKLLATILAAAELRQQRKEGRGERKEKNKQLRQEVGVSLNVATQRVLEMAVRVAETDANVLILGENGTGKTQLAQLIHQNSLRAAKPFVTVDLGAISESLFESELFGHVKGAFTDAKEDRAGRFEEAQGGTIFLDEIGNLSLSMQIKLLTVLQNRTVTRVGSNKPRNMDVRLLCATNQPLSEMVLNRTFRQDLMYRINTIELLLPPLRERTEDIVPLAEQFLKQYRQQYKRPITSMSAVLVKQLQRYDWPGNIRELQHAVERAVILAKGSMLQPEDFFFDKQPDAGAFADTFQIEEMEKNMVLKSLKKFNGNITEAAKELGLSRAALYRRLEKYGL